jgi:uncharacterized RDD family membrane protein YckC
MERIWFYAEGNETIGPLPLNELISILSRLPDAKSVLVWRDGFAAWQTAGSVRELAQYIIKPPPLPVSSRASLQTAPPVAILPPHSAVTASAAGLLSNPHAWRRYFARLIDIWIFFLIGGLFLGLALPELFETTSNSAQTRTNDYLFSMVGLGLYAIFEAVCLNVFGITFGKFLYGIGIWTKEGDQLAFSTALKRSLAVWIRGFAFGIPFVALITLYVAYSTLWKEGQTSWDRDFNCMVVHKDFSALRWLAIAISWVILLSTYAILIAVGSGAR